MPRCSTTGVWRFWVDYHPWVRFDPVTAEVQNCYMLKEASFGLAVVGCVGSLFVAGSVFGTGCGPAAAIQCRAEAVKFLPADPGQITAYDVTDLVERLKACKAGDAGR